jgi:hypothetical protein
LFAYIGDAKRDFERDGRVDTEWLERQGTSDDHFPPDNARAKSLGPSIDLPADLTPADSLDPDQSTRTDGLRARPLRRRYAPANTRALVIRSRVN